MIIAANRQHKIGDRIEVHERQSGICPSVMAVVVRESSLSEFEADHRSIEADNPNLDIYLRNPYPFHFHYEVSTD